MCKCLSERCSNNQAIKQSSNQQIYKLTNSYIRIWPFGMPTLLRLTKRGDFNGSSVTRRTLFSIFNFHFVLLPRRTSFSIFNFQFSICIAPSANTLFIFQFSICIGPSANTLFNFQVRHNSHRFIC